MRNRLGVGVIGCGNISGNYLHFCRDFPVLDVVACADLDPGRAHDRAREFNVPRACTVEELFADPAVDIVLNLTIPLAHAEISLAAIHAGKHVYSEKPFGITAREGRAIIEAARDRGVRVGSAPDTFLGGGLQTCRKLIDDGAIGEPVSAAAFMMCHGHEHWHPAPAFYYERGGGPMLDMGPYYVTALVSLLGPARRVVGSARVTFPERVVSSEPEKGRRIRVEVPTHVAGIVDFASGAVAVIVTSFDVWASELPRIEIHGTEGSMLVPDPNSFDGPVRIRRAGDEAWADVPLTHPGNTGRGIGVADMAYAILQDRPHRASDGLAGHVLDILEAFPDSSEKACHVLLSSTCVRPAALPPGTDSRLLVRS